MNANVPAGAANGAALNKPLAGDPTWLLEALKLDGLKEVPGSGHNPEIVKLFADAGAPQVKDDETAWCAAFVGACLRRSGYLSTGALTARSYLKFGKEVSDPQRGDIAVFSRGNSAWQGHVGFVVKANQNYVWLLGGNQDNAVNVTRYGRGNLLGFRRPVATKMVLEVQKRLTELGFNPADNVDGIYGPTTKKAITRYEISKGYAPFDSVAQIHRHLLSPAKPNPPPEPVIIPAKPDPLPPDVPVIEPEPAKPKKGSVPLGVILAALIALAAAGVALFVPLPI